MVKKVLLLLLVLVFAPQKLNAQIPKDEELLKLALEQYVFSRNYIQQFIKNFNHTELINEMTLDYDTIYVIDLKEPKDSLNWIDKSKTIVYVDVDWIEERGLLYTEYGERKDRLLFTGCLLYRFSKSDFFGVRTYYENIILKQIKDRTSTENGIKIPDFIRYFNNYLHFTLSNSGRNRKRLYLDYKLDLKDHNCYVSVRLDLINKNFLSITETSISFPYYQKYVYLYTRNNKLIGYKVCNLHKKCSNRRLKPNKKYRKLDLNMFYQNNKPILAPL